MSLGIEHFEPFLAARGPDPRVFGPQAPCEAPKRVPGVRLQPAWVGECSKNGHIGPRQPLIRCADSLLHPQPRIPQLLDDDGGAGGAPLVRDPLHGGGPVVVPGAPGAAAAEVDALGVE